MRFSIEVVTREEFDAWVAEQSGIDLAAKQP
jgi:heme/copper-type cytochrome/quinol oxidase subunit 2